MPLRHISDPIREQVPCACGRVALTANGDGVLGLTNHHANLNGHNGAGVRLESPPRDSGRCPLHSISSSARATSDGGMVRPIDFAVLRLITNSYLLGACTGRLPGFS